MNEYTAQSAKRYSSPQAVLAGIGAWVRGRKILEPIKDRVKIPQKTVKYTPFEKLMDAFITILSGAHGLVEVNKRVRSDLGLQASFGRTGCAEQSVVQATLDAVTEENVLQMYAAYAEIYQQQSAGYRHDYQRSYQILDVDMSGMVCGSKAAFATRGYFTRRPRRHGRQLGRVLATTYGEVVVDRVFPGNQQLVQSLIPLMEAAEQTLQLTETTRARNVLRVDSGGGTPKDINWVLERGYQFHGKEYSAQTTDKLAQSVTEWIVDPRVPGREVGWVTAPADTQYVRAVRRVAVRCRKRNGQWGCGVLVTTLSDEDAIALTRQPCHQVHNPQAVLLALVYFYDQRGGGIETSFKEDSQGLGIKKRNKKSFEAQQLLAQLNALAHNVIVWVQASLGARCPRVAHFGVLRFVRDVFHTLGNLMFDAEGRLQECVLNQDDAIARALVPALAALLSPEHVVVNSGET